MADETKQIRITIESEGIVRVSGPAGFQPMRIVAGRGRIAAAAGHRVTEILNEMFAEPAAPIATPVVPPGWPGKRPVDPDPSLKKRPYGYREDPTVPAFPDDKPIIVFDGHCALCSGWVRFVIRHDRSRRYRFLAAQAPTGQALYAHYGMDTRDFESNILLEDGVRWLRMEGTVRMAAGLGFPWTMARLVRVLPVRLQDALYDLVARNRLRVFGRLDACMRPDPAEADRFIS